MSHRPDTPQGLVCPRGWTLIEMLVALAVFGIVSLVAHQSLRGTLQHWPHLTTHAKRLHQLAMCHHILARDLLNRVPVRITPTHTEPGLTVFAPHPGPGVQPHPRWGMPRLSFQTGGLVRAPHHPTHSTIASVVYFVRDHQLIRFSKPLDSTPPQANVLLEGLASWDVQVLDPQAHTLVQWPPRDQPHSVPQALRVDITWAPRHHITWWFALSHGAMP